MNVCFWVLGCVVVVVALWQLDEWARGERDGWDEPGHWL